jgi:hypothetical protein
MATNHILSQNTRIYVDGYDISGDGSSLEVNAASVMADDSTFTNTGRTHKKGIKDDSLNYDGFFDDDAAQVDAIFAALREAAGSSVDIVSNYPDLDTVGKTGTAGLIENSNYTVPSKVAELVLIKGNFGIEGGLMKVRSLGTKATITGTTTSTAVDDGAQSLLGGTWFIHVFAIACSGGNACATFTLQDSANGSAWLTVGTESYNISGSTPTQALHSFTGTLREYVRLVVTKDCTTMSITYQAGYHRGLNDPTN